MSAEENEVKPAIREIFLKAVDLSAADREAYLARTCGTDFQLRSKVEALLRSNEDDSFLESPAAQVSSTVIIAPGIAEGPGSVIDKYKLLEKLGEGGFGVVYMAEQKQPVKRRVALKIIKVGMDTREVVARFEAERQALAVMDHPNIAKVFDAGATETGRPFFVMELVRGVKITDYCDEKNLSTRERLDLFMEVCQAVQHAHQKGIIHRDLKPSNILVTVNDGVAVPKIIDFGIAKATQMELTEKTVFTRFQQFIGTPAYMSPEQAEITSVDIDTRSDIYSLGVLLYELLTGKTPFDAKELLQAGLDEMRRTLREKEPDRPSTRVSTLGGEELTTTAKRRGLEAPKLANSLRGDLDWIVMKCLEKDRARRYETANGLAMDIQRHLRNEPVVACPPSQVYRLQKAIRRNKGVFAAAAIILVLLIAGIGISTWQAIRARRAELEQLRFRQQAQANEQEAKAEAEKKEQVSQFLASMFEGVGPSVAMGRDTTILREILDTASSRISAELTNQPEIEQFLRFTIGHVYNSIGQHERAEVSLRQAVAAGNKTGQANYTEKQFAHWLLARVLMDLERREEAEAEFRKQLSDLEKLPTDYKNRDLMMANTLDQLAISLIFQGRVSAGEPFAIRALEMRPKIEDRFPRVVAANLNNRALCFREEGKFSQAESLLREELQILDRLNLNDADKLFPEYNLAVVLEHGAKLAEAENRYRHCLEVAQKLVGGNPEAALGLARNISVYFYGLRAVLIKEGKRDEAETCRREALSSALSLADFPPLRNEQEKPDILGYRAEFLARLGRWSDAARDLTRVRELVGDDRIMLWRELARILFQAGEFDVYRRYCTMSLERFSGTKDLNFGLDVAMNVLISTSSVPDLTTVTRMAETACDLGRGSSKYSWYVFCRGLADYRHANFPEAIGVMEKLLAESSGESRRPAYCALPGDPSELEVGAYAVLAMAQERLHHPSDSRNALAKAREIANTKLGKPGEDDLSFVWSDWIMAQALLREAKELIEGPGTGPVSQGRAEVSNRPQPAADPQRKSE